MVIGLAACTGVSSTPQIEVSGAWVRASGRSMEGGQIGSMQIQPMNSAAYMVLRNRGGTADKLVDVLSDVAEVVELHKSEMKDGVMTMNPVEFVEVPAGGQVEFKPGSFHVMLVGIKKELIPGDKVTLTLVFERSGEKTVEAEGRAP
jgi:copper(I)-binding protein